MPSVVVSWKGRCSERKLQDELLSFIRLLASKNAERWAQPPTQRPRFVELISQQRTKGLSELPNVREFDQEISGRILVCSDLVQPDERRTLRVLAAQRSLACERLGDRPEPFVVVLDRLRIRGIDFRLYDPRALYPAEDRMGFVFLESATLPLLNGSIGLVHDRDRCMTRSNVHVRSADWYIECPCVHLRYYLETWLDDLLSWIKIFFIPDLYYYDYYTEKKGPLHYEQLGRTIEQLQSQIGVSEAKKRSFERLVEVFNLEADRWTEKMKSW